MPATLVLMTCAWRTGGWVRKGQLTFEDHAIALGEAKARSYGEAWISEGSDERRAYSVLLAWAPSDWQRV
jgi:hypothetical protein